MRLKEKAENYQWDCSRLMYEIEEHPIMIPNPNYQEKFLEKLFKRKDDIKTPRLVVKSSVANKYIIYKSNNSFFRSYTYKTTTINKDELVQCSIEKSLINRVCVKIAIAPKIDRDAINTFINYINRENDQLSLDQIYAVLVYCMNQALNLESKLMILKNIGLNTELNSLKADEYKLLPDGFIDAYFKEQLWDFIKFKVKTSLGLGINLDNNDVKLSNFQ
jgi:hypothetical protein